jgi:DNA polymerase IV
MTDFKAQIISELATVSKLSAAEPNGAFKVRSYTAAINKLKKLPQVLTVEDAAGIGGAKIQEKIATIIATGSLGLSEAEVAAAAVETPEQIFGKIYGVGPATAKKLVAAGYTSIADLRAGNAELTPAQTAGLQHYEDLLERIPRAEMDKHAGNLLRSAEKVGLTGVITGSYRRGAASSGDIDMLVTHASPEQGAAALRALVEYLVKKTYVKAVLSLGEHMCLAIASLVKGGRARRVDILLTPPEELPFALAHFTGPAEFNVAMRQEALKRGYSLSQRGLTRVSNEMPVTGITSEKELLEFFGFGDFLDPRTR